MIRDKVNKIEVEDIDLQPKQTENTTMCYASHIVSFGQHSITNSNPMAAFYVSVYCICESECDSSYAYSANAYYSQGT